MAESPSLTPPRRRWLRFSLRTLLLFVLLIGSAATLWWNWGPWTVAFSVEAPGRVTAVEFSDDDAFLIIHYGESRSYENGGLDIYCTQNGLRHALIKDQPGTNGARLDGSYVEFVVISDGFRPFLWEEFNLFDWRENRPLPCKEKMLHDNQPPVEWGWCKEFVAARYGKSWLVYKLPEFNVVYESPTNARVDFLSDGRLAVSHNHPLRLREVTVQQTRQLEILDLRTGKSVRSPLAPNDLNVHVTNITEQRNCAYIEIEYSLGAAYHKQMMDSFNGTLSPFRLFRRRFIDCGNRALVGGEQGGADLIDVQSGCVLKHFEENNYNLRFSPHCDLVLNPEKGEAFDVKDFKLRWKIDWTDLFYSGDGRFLCAQRANDANKEETAIVDPQNGAELWRLSPWRERQIHAQFPFLRWNHHSADFVVWSQEEPGSRYATLFRLRRPVAMYGPAYLPEFWLTLVLGTGFLWSVWRDRRLGRRG